MSSPPSATAETVAADVRKKARRVVGEVGAFSLETDDAFMIRRMVWFWFNVGRHFAAARAI